MDVNKIFTGTFGKVHVNGQLLANVTMFEAKATAKYEDVDTAGNLGTDKKFIGWEGKGTIKCHKIDSLMAKSLTNGFKTGIMPVFKILGRLSAPGIDGEEAVELTKITFDELTFGFVIKKKLEEEMPFSFGDFNPIDFI